jgi:hypothetical protein
MMAAGGATWSQTPAPTISPNSGGLLGQYYTVNHGTAYGASGDRPSRNRIFVTPINNRLDTEVNMGFPSGVPIARSSSLDDFAVRWTGQVQPQFKEDYTFYASADDGIRVWVSDKPIDPADPGTPAIPNCEFGPDPDFPTDPFYCKDKNLDSWKNQGDGNLNYASKPISLDPAKKYFLLVEYYENGGGEAAHLGWSSASTPKQIISLNQLFPEVLDTADGGAPPQITDLAPDATVTPTDTAVTINFTAPGDDPGAGRAQDYDIRFSRVNFSTTPYDPTNPINFYSVGHFDQTKGPLAAGGKEAITITGLQPLTTYYIAVRAADNAANLSPVSNVVKIQTKNANVPLPPAEGNPGFTAYYYKNVNGSSPDRNVVFNLVNLVFGRDEDKIDYDYGGGVPAGAPPGFPGDHWGTRWYAKLKPTGTGEFTITTRTDDGGRAWISENPIDPANPGTPLVDGWFDQGPTDFSGKINLDASKSYYMMMEFYENGGGAFQQLRWKGPGTGPNADGSDVPIPKENATTANFPGIVIPDTGRIKGRIVDVNTGNAITGGVTVRVTTADGLVNNLTPNGQGLYSGLVTTGEATITAFLSNWPDISMDLGKITITKDQEVVKNVEFEGNLKSLGTAQSLRSDDLKAANLPGWDFLPMAVMPNTEDVGKGVPDIDRLVIEQAGADGKPNQVAREDLLARIGGNITTTGEFTWPSGLKSSWYPNWEFVPGDAGGPGRKTTKNAAGKDILTPDPNGIPDNSDWVQSLKFKVAPVANATRYAIGNFVVDDRPFLFALNGVKIAGNSGGCCQDITVRLPPGNAPLVIDGQTDNRLTIVGFEGGGGAGITGGDPKVRAFGPTSLGVANPPMVGDVTGDGKISIKDATASLQIALDMRPVASAQVLTDDADKNLVLNVADTVKILKILVGL